VAVNFVSAIFGVDVGWVAVACAVTVGCPCVGTSYRGVGTVRAGVSVGDLVGGGDGCGEQAIIKTNKAIMIRFIG
jgi:hypothetical protein